MSDVMYSNPGNTTRPRIGETYKAYFTRSNPPVRQRDDLEIYVYVYLTSLPIL